MKLHPPSFEPREVPLLDIARDQEPLREAMRAAVEGVLDSGRYLHGPDVAGLERELAARCQTDHAIGCASGSDALLLALMALNIGRGDEVIVPSFTFFATASAVWRLGATLVFVDIDPQTFNLSVPHLEAVVSRRTKAVIPVHLYGQCAAMDRIRAIARQHDVWVIEDAAQAIGAAYQGRAAGAWGHVGCFSFYPTKNLGGCGDGGMMTVQDAELAERLRLFAAHGMHPRYYHQVVGINSRLDSLQAAVLRIKLRQLERWTAQRQENARRYERLFRAAGLDRVLTLPATAPEAVHVWNQYTIRVPDGRRDGLRQHLTERGVGSEIYYPLPLHRQACFLSLGYDEGSLPESERAGREVLSLPIFPGLTEAEQRVVVGRIAEYYLARQVQAA